MSTQPMLRPRNMRPLKVKARLGPTQQAVIEVMRGDALTAAQVAARLADEKDKRFPDNRLVRHVLLKLETRGVVRVVAMLPPMRLHGRLKRFPRPVFRVQRGPGFWERMP